LTAAPAADWIERQVRSALAEDLGDGDASAGLIDPRTLARATLITRSHGRLAGRAWFEATLAACDRQLRCHWQAEEGAPVEAGQCLARIEGPARALLAAERTALNFLQLLSAIASRTADYVAAVAGTQARILDTRKTLPGLRQAQKYAVRVGGGHNHRFGLFDMIMLKENHLAAAGDLAVAVARARALRPELLVEVETEDLDQFQQALAAGADRIMLDNFSVADLTRAVELGKGRAVLEASGGITLETVRPIAKTGVDDLSIGELTKAIDPLDLSLRFV